MYICIFFCSFTTPQAFWQSSAPGALSTLVTSVVLYSLTRATLMSPGKDGTRVCGCIYIYIYIYMYILYFFFTNICMPLRNLLRCIWIKYFTRTCTHSTN